MVIGILIGAAGLLVVVFLCAWAVEQTPSARLTQSSPANPNISLMEISTNGVEQFTPILLQGRVYRFVITGTYKFWSQGIFCSSQAWADGGYYADNVGNYTCAYPGMLINGSSRRALDSWKEDRSIHEYCCLVEGTGEGIPVRVLPPKSGVHERGHLNLNIELQPPGTVTARAREAAATLARLRAEQTAEQARLQTEKAAQQLAEQQRQQAEQAAQQLAEQQRQQAEAAKAAADAAALKVETAAKAQEEQRKRQELADQHSAALMQRVDQLRRSVHQMRHFLDPKVCAEYVSHFQQEVISSREQWRQEYNTIFGDSELVAALKSAAPEVLRWYEARIDMIIDAERALIMPIPLAAPPTRKITASTMPYVSQTITELFEFTDLYDRTRRELAEDGDHGAHRPVLDNAKRATAFYYEELARFGITASSPEDAEMQYFTFCPPPAPTFYEAWTSRIKAGEKLSTDPLRSRLEDLFREDLKLAWRRRRAVERNNGPERNAIDIRLETVRRESADLKTVMESLGQTVKFQDYREQELSLVEQLKRSISEQKEFEAFTDKLGDPDAKEQGKALFASRNAKLFEDDSAGYT